MKGELPQAIAENSQSRFSLALSIDIEMFEDLPDRAS
jgi:hypothetical protein